MGDGFKPGLIGAALLLVVALGLVGCAPLQVVVMTPTPAPTEFATGTPTANVTATATATQAPEPTATEPTATATAPSTPTQTPTTQPSPTQTPQPTRYALGPEWGGDTAGYYSDGERLVTDGGGAIFWRTQYGPDQEVFVTLSEIDAASERIGLLLLGQSDANIEAGALEVVYSPTAGVVAAWVRRAGVGQPVGGDVPVTFAAGDQFGARVAGNQLTVYRNGSQVAAWTLDLPGWNSRPGGFVGLVSDDGANGFDDFGGGTFGPAQPGA